MADGLTLTSHPTIRAPSLLAPAPSLARENRTRSPDPETPIAGASGTPSQCRSWSWDEDPTRAERWNSDNWDRPGRSKDDLDDSYGYDSHDDYSPAKMSTWVGQPKVEGSSETVRMVLLTCVSIGITYVPA